MRIEKLWIYAFSLTLHKIGGGQHRDVEEIKRQQKKQADTTFVYYYP